MIAPTSSRPTGLRIAALVVWIAAVLWSVADLWLDGVSGVRGAPVALGLRIVQIVVCAVATVVVVRSGRDRGAGRWSIWTWVRVAAYSGALGVLLTTLFTGIGSVHPRSPAVRSILISGVFLGLAAGILVWRFRGVELPRRVRIGLRAVDLVLFNLVACAVFLELALLFAQRVFPSQILWDDSTVASSLLALRQCEGHYPQGGFTYQCNSRGYPDEEFVKAGKNDYVVALLADSFGAGSVPFEFNFARLAELEMRTALAGRYDRVAIDNFGVNGADMPEYHYLLHHEVLDENPALVVVAVFVGNDIGGIERTEGYRPMQGHRRLQDWLFVRVIDRLYRVHESLEEVTPPGKLVDVDVPAYIHDTSLEPPYFTESVFLRIESQRLAVCAWKLPQTQELYREFFAGLDDFHDLLGDRLMLLVIPDEYQVNDHLWSVLTSSVYAPSSLERDYPQRRIRDWAKERGVEVLDVLPELREAEREDRTYHLRDTHWNARGNRVAATALAQALIRRAGATDSGAGPSRAPDEAVARYR